MRAGATHVKTVDGSSVPGEAVDGPQPEQLVQAHTVVEDAAASQAEHWKHNSEQSYKPRTNLVPTQVEEEYRRAELISKSQAHTRHKSSSRTRRLIDHKTYLIDKFKTG